MNLSQLHHAPSLNLYPQNQTHTQTILPLSSNYQIQQQHLHSTQYIVHSKSKIHNKNPSTIAASPIQQNQQPSENLNELGVSKQPSLISCKSQPLNLNSCKKMPANCIFPKSQNRQKQIISTKTQANNYIKTRKLLTKPKIVSYVETLTNLDHEYQKAGNTKDFKKVRFNEDKKVNFNEKTLRVNNSCRHKSYKQLQNGISLQKISNRLQWCQAYIELSQRKTSLLTRELEYLLTKQLQRQQRRTKKMQTHRLKHQSSKHLITSLCLLSPKKLAKCQHTSTSKNKNKKQPHQNQLYLHSRNTFHFRSHDSRPSKMKSLIYFHQKQTKNKTHKCGHEKQMKIRQKDNKEQKYKDNHTINQVSTSIYDS